MLSNFILISIFHLLLYICLYSILFYSVGCHYNTVQYNITWCAALGHKSLFKHLKTPHISQSRASCRVSVARILEKSDCIVMASHYISISYCKKDVTPLLTHLSYVFLALTHRYAIITIYPLTRRVVWYIGSKSCNCLSTKPRGTVESRYLARR